MIILATNNNLIKNIISNLQINIELAGYTQCWKDWQDFDYTPSYNKFYFICQGEGWLKIKDKEFYPKPGQLFLMPANVKQSYCTISQNPFIKYWCHFTAKIMDKNLFDFIQTPYFIEVSNIKKIETLFNDLIKYYEDNHLSSLLSSKAILLEIIAEFIGHIEPGIHISLNQSSDSLNSIIEYIEKNISENITIEKLAKIANYHPNYFIRIFKSNIGISPIQYINRIRLEKAKKLIMQSNMTIGEIASSVGINDVSHFSKSFKNYTGFTPSEFKKISHKV